MADDRRAPNGAAWRREIRTIPRTAAAACAGACVARGRSALDSATARRMGREALFRSPDPGDHFHPEDHFDPVDQANEKTGFGVPCPAVTRSWRPSPTRHL